MGHLLDLGHRHVAHVAGPPTGSRPSSGGTGWRRAHEQRGLLTGPELDGDWSPLSGYRAGLLVADDPDVTAVFAGNDSMALGLLNALHERGRRVPDDVSVVGFDDVPGGGVLLAGAHDGVAGLLRARPACAEPGARCGASGDRDRRPSTSWSRP